MSEKRGPFRRTCFNCGAGDVLANESSLISITPVIYRRGPNGRQNKSGTSITLCEKCLESAREQAGEILRREAAATLRNMKAGF